MGRVAGLGGQSREPRRHLGVSSTLDIDPVSVSANEK